MDFLAGLRRERAVGGFPLAGSTYDVDLQGIGTPDVRIHTSAAADRLVRDVNARSFSVGGDIMFADGAFRPETRTGRGLLAHELAHSVRARTDVVDVLRRQPDEQAQHDQPVTSPRADLHLVSPWLDGLRAVLPGRPALRLIEEELILHPLGSSRPVIIPMGMLTAEQMLSLLPYLDAAPESNSPFPAWLLDPAKPALDGSPDHAVQEPEQRIEGTLIYRNDGSRSNPGAGSDQGFTAGARAVFRWDNPTWWPDRFGVSMEMHTPRGFLPPGAEFGPSQTYETAPGPYLGLLYFDFAYNVHSGGGHSVWVIGHAGVNAATVIAPLQHFIHREISDSPLFPWPRGAEPYLGTGVGHGYERELPGLTHRRFDSLLYRGRLVVNSEALLSTHRSEGTVDARIILESQRVETAAGTLSFEFGGGIIGRAFARYNDGRVEPIVGVEGGFTSEAAVNLDLGRTQLGLGLRGETIHSTDPARQTGVEDEASTLLPQAVQLPSGKFGSGEVMLRLRVPF